jgi:hypothetical protein
MDEVVEELELPEDEAFVPRNQAGDPLRVVLEDVQPGNFLEVDYRMNFQNLSYYYEDPFDVLFAVLVTFDGSDPAFDPATPQTLYLFNSNSTSSFPPVGQEFTFSADANGLALAEIPEGATTATVQVLYNGGPFAIEVEPPDGEEVEFSDNSGTLKVTELSGSSVAQTAGRFLPADEL